MSKNVDLSHYLFWNLYNLAELTNFKINPKNTQDSDLLKIVNSKEYKNHREFAMKKVSLIFKTDKNIDFDKNDLILVMNF